MTAAPATAPPVLSVRNLVKHFPVRSRGLLRRQVGEVHAVCGVSFDLAERETLGLVGESGCGKSTTARVLLNLQPATSGEVFYQGRELTSLSRSQMRALRRDLQIVFQDPYASLDPRMPVNEIVAEPLRIHGLYGDEGRTVVRDLLRTVGLKPEHGNRFPHEFSGGQRQRIGVARALALRPKVLVLDEPVSALDVSIQSQMLNLLDDLQKELQLTYIFIAHDLGVVRHVSDRIAVMYLGEVVELAPADALYAAPAHPYTEALLSAVPEIDDGSDDAGGYRRDRIVLEGDVPSPIHKPAGCPFHPRCPYAQDRCRAERPMPRELAPGRQVTCHFPRPGGSFPVTASPAR